MKVRWIIGAAVLLLIVGAIIFFPPALMFYPHLPFSEFFRRGFYILLLAGALCFVRIIKGPTAADRIVAIDILGILIVGLTAILGIPTGRSWYIDIGIAWALQSFIGSLALAKYLERKDFDE